MGVEGLEPGAVGRGGPEPDEAVGPDQDGPVRRLPPVARLAQEDALSAAKPKRAVRAGAKRTEVAVSKGKTARGTGAQAAAPSDPPGAPEVDPSPTDSKSP